MVTALTAIRRALTSPSTPPTSLGWGAPRTLNSMRSARNPHLAGWRDRVRIVALAQGGAEHYLRGRRGVRDLDVIVCFAADPLLPHLFRRMIVSWDWGPSKLGRCPHDPPDYTGRAVDVAFWVIPDRPSPIAALREWLAERAARKADPARNPDLAHEPVVLIHPDLGSVAWDPGRAPPPKPKTTGHRKPHGLVPPDRGVSQGDRASCPCHGHLSGRAGCWSSCPAAS
jgi:hypothetical protein